MNGTEPLTHVKARPIRVLEFSRLDFGDDTVSLNFQGLQGAPNKYSNRYLETAPVPVRALGTASLRGCAPVPCLESAALAKTKRHW